MPTIHDERGVLVVRVVYDGPPMSGKTTSLRTLAQGLGVTMSTPAERDGRTLFFDWVEYVGGLFEGRKIRCQIVSVPGQIEYWARRDHLLSSADAIVLVADTREQEIEAAYDLLRDLRLRCRATDPPVGVVLQANKRDAPDALPRHRIHDAVSAIAPVAMIETIATSGEGVREAFVFAVRLALDRVRALAESGQLAEGRPEVDSAAELLEELTSLEAASRAPSNRPSARGVELAHEVSEVDQQIAQLAGLGALAPATSAPLADDEHVFVPDPTMPGGLIWPPVDGRTLLAEVSALRLLPARTPRGDWWASGSGWRFHSRGDALFADVEQGRRALIEWARLHAAYMGLLSAGRTIILAPAGGGRSRLWQLVRAVQSLRELLASAASQAQPEPLAGYIAGAAERLLRARELFDVPELGLSCTLWSVSAAHREIPRFVGLMPRARQEVRPEAEGEALLVREFAPVLAGLARDREDYPAVAGALSRAHDRDPKGPVRATLARLAVEALGGGTR